MQTASGVGGSFGLLGWCAVVEVMSHSLLHAGLLGIADTRNERDPRPHARPSRLGSTRHRLSRTEPLQALSTAPSTVLGQSCG